MTFGYQSRVFQTSISTKEMDREIPYRIMRNGKCDGIAMFSRNEAILFNTNATLQGLPNRLYRVRLSWDFIITPGYKKSRQKAGL
jgi:hypothetical protein